MMMQGFSCQNHVRAVIRQQSEIFVCATGVDSPIVYYLDVRKHCSTITNIEDVWIFISFFTWTMQAFIANWLSTSSLKFWRFKSFLSTCNSYLKLVLTLFRQQNAKKKLWAPLNSDQDNYLVIKISRCVDFENDDMALNCAWKLYFAIQQQL